MIGLAEAAVPMTWVLVVTGVVAATAAGTWPLAAVILLPVAASGLGYVIGVAIGTAVISERHLMRAVKWR